jgi:hypothetical protein
MRRAREDLQPAFGYRSVRAAPVRDGDGLVAPSPDDQGGNGPQELEAVTGADPLSLDVDHRAERL